MSCDALVYYIIVKYGSGHRLSLIELFFFVSQGLNILCIMFKIVGIIIPCNCYIWGLAFRKYLESACMTTSFHKEGRLGNIKNSLGLPHCIEVAQCTKRADKSTNWMFKGLDAQLNGLKLIWSERCTNKLNVPAIFNETFP